MASALDNVTSPEDPVTGFKLDFTDPMGTVGKLVGMTLALGFVFLSVDMAREEITPRVSGAVDSVAGTNAGGDNAGNTFGSPE